MKVFDSENIRNIAIVGHGDAGKTSLVSAMLYSAGAVNRLGRVEEGNTVTDYDEDEIQRRITINTALGRCEWNNTKINLLDTPGYRAFILDAKAASIAAEAAARSDRCRRRAWKSRRRKSGPMARSSKSRV